MNDIWFEPGHVAIVTGGSKGLGKALARELVRRGVTTIVDGRDAAVLESARTELEPLGQIVAIAGDVADKEHVHALIAAAKRLGRLDLLVNNASTLGETPLPRVDELAKPVFERLFDVNVFAPIHLMQHALPLLLRHGGPATIVNVTSDAAANAYAGWGGYGASKAALEHISRVLAEELADPRLRVLAFDPGDMNTEMHRAAIPDADPESLRDPADSAAAMIAAIAGASSGFSRIGPEIAVRA